MIGEAIREALGRPLESALSFLTDAFLDGELNARLTVERSAFRMDAGLVQGMMTISVKPRGVMNVVEDAELHSALFSRIQREPGTGHNVLKTCGCHIATWRPER